MDQHGARLAAKNRDAGPKQGASETRFRGTWNLASKAPTFNAFAFLPTPVPQKPRLAPTVEPCELALAPVGELVAPPSDVMLRIRDRCGNYRGCILPDGEAINNRGQTLGYINDDQCGSAEMEYLGSIKPQWDESLQIVEDALDETAATLEMGGNCYLRDSNDRIVCEISHNGVCTGHAGSYLGEFEGFSFHHLKMMALYLVLIDPGMLNEVEG